MVAIKELFIKLLASLKRFPEVILLATAVVITLIFLNHLGYSDPAAFRNHLTKLAMVLALGIPLFLSVKLIFERLPDLKSWLKATLYLAVIIGLILYYLFGLKKLVMVPVTRYIALTIAFYSMFLFIPCFFKRKNFEIYCVHLLTGLAITYFYAAVLYLGLSAMLFTVSKLFLIKLGKVYFDIWLAVAGIFAPAYFLADLPAIKKELQVESFSKVLKILLLYIVIPMIAVYSMILYVYFAKIIITRVWPAGIVSHLVLWYSLLSNIVFFMVYPLRNDLKWLAKCIAYFPKIILPLLAMMFVSMGIRVHAYGVTESRYFVLLAGLWVSGWMLYYLFTNRVRNIILPISLTIIAILSVIGPWSAFAVSKFDQNSRLTAILKKYNMLQGQALVKPNRPISATDKAQIISVLSYFKDSHSLGDADYLPDHFKLSEMPKIFGFKWNPDSNYQSYFNYQFVNNRNTELTDIQGFDYFIKITQTDITKNNPDKRLRISYSLERHELKITAHDQEIYKKRVSDLVIPLFKKRISPGEEAVHCLDETAKVKVFYEFDTISGQTDPATDEMNINYMNFEAFIKLK